MYYLTNKRTDRKDHFMKNGERFSLFYHMKYTLHFLFVSTTHRRSYEEQNHIFLG